MLSILIPTFNYDIRELVFDLYNQASALNIDFEIVAVEDGSTEFLKENCQIESLKNVKYEVLPQNIGRAAIRNYLINNAIYDYLLFLDCDSEICNPDFLKRYIENCNKNCVINGGITYDWSKKNPKYSLRFKYGKLREAKTAQERINQKFSFTTFNLLIYRQIFNKIHFDEQIKTYGYEDLQLGYCLIKSGYNITHIDNALIHKGLDENHIFLQKAETGINNLLKLYKSPECPNLKEFSKILSIFFKIEKLKLNTVIAFLYRIFKRFIIKNLTGNNPSLFLFDFYKLGILCNIEKNIKQTKT